MYDDATIGARLRILRNWRRLTQQELADLSGLSQGFVSLAERGERTLDRRSHIAALASALRVSETELVGGPHLSADPLQSDPHMAIPAIRMALQTNTLTSPAVERARPVPELAAEMARIEPYHQACNYVEVGKSLPDLLDELHLHVCEPEDEAALRLALETLVQACTAATFTSKDLGYPDLAHLAAVRAEEAASLLDDPVARGQAEFLRVATMPRADSWGRTLTKAERAADALEPHAVTPLGRQVLGMLTLKASLVAAIVHNGAKADHWMSEATGIAGSLPDDPDAAWMSFSQTNVGVWRVAVSVEQGRTGRAVLDVARSVDETKLSDKRGRHAAFLADVGRGLAREPKLKDEAITYLRRAEDTAPQWIRNNPAVRESIAVMLKAAMMQAGGRELRGMAARMGVLH
jgi:transcriptional regulator with XRE-family HTH domain